MPMQFIGIAHDLDLMQLLVCLFMICLPICLSTLQACTRALALGSLKPEVRRVLFAGKQTVSSLDRLTTRL